MLDKKLVCKYVFNRDTTWCGKKTRRTANQWDEVTCPNCLKFKPRYTRIKQGEHTPRQKKEFVVDMDKLRTYWSKRDVI